MIANEILTLDRLKGIDNRKQKKQKKKTKKKIDYNRV